MFIVPRIKRTMLFLSCIPLASASITSFNGSAVEGLTSILEINRNSPIAAKELKREVNPKVAEASVPPAAVPVPTVPTTEKGFNPPAPDRIPPNVARRAINLEISGISMSAIF